jgi:GLPGLI family protein
MKRIMSAAIALMLLMNLNAQQKEGMIVYERTVQMQVSFPGLNEEMQRHIPKSRTDKYELHFGNNQSVWKMSEVSNETENVFGSTNEGGGGIQIRMAPGGTDDMIYTNFDTRRKVELREMMDKKFVIDDSVNSLKWKMTGESKIILNHNCMKATATQISQRSQMSMQDGKMTRKEVADTSNITAWFASDIPVSAGPSEYQGQLPGLILELDVNSGKQYYKAIDIQAKTDLAKIKEPTGKKRYSRDEYNKERQKMMDQMNQNNSGGGTRRIIMN